MPDGKVAPRAGARAGVALMHRPGDLPPRSPLFDPQSMPIDRPASTVSRNRQIAIATTAIVLMVVVVMLARRSPLASGGSDEPTDCVYAMAEAARDGDVDAYLACFTGSLRDRLARQAAEGAAGGRFAASLRAGGADLTGVVLQDLEYAGTDRAQVVLEYVYTGYNERRQVRLRRVDGEWKITEMTPPRQFMPEVPYGTPANPPVRSTDTEDQPSPPQ